MREESWLKQYWRPAIAWQYFAVCVFDFIIFPAAYMYFSREPWDPITLKEGGFYHLKVWRQINWIDNNLSLSL